MSVHTVIVGDSTTRIWGLSGADRLRRQLAGLPGVTGTHSDPAPLPAGDLLLLRGDHVFDARAVHTLVETPGPLLLKTEGRAVPVAARVPHDLYPQARAALEGSEISGTLAALPVRRPADLAAAFQKSLRKVEAPQVWPITAAGARALEQELFGGAYKGVTDLVTKWLWPVPAMWATRLCVRLGLLPNHVTLLGLALAILAAIGFWQGAFGPALIVAWFMTFLDTVDGKLARVTITSSRFGDVLDHGLDLLHPPIWYVAWGLGCAEWNVPIDLGTALWLMFWGYLGGRVCEGAFHLMVAPFSMFVWRPFDSLNRLVTARRNPNLILLSAAWLLGRPDVGLVAVVAWHLLSTMILAVRLCIGLWIRLREGPQQPWLAQVDAAADRHRLAVRLFTRLPAAGVPLD